MKRLPAFVLLSMLLLGSCSKKNISLSHDSQKVRLSRQLEESYAYHESSLPGSLKEEGKAAGEVPGPVTGNRYRTEEKAYPEKISVKLPANQSESRIPSDSIKTNKSAREDKPAKRHNLVLRIGEGLLILGILFLVFGVMNFLGIGKKEKEEDDKTHRLLFGIGLFMLAASVPFLLIGLVIYLIRKK